jgi:hypothetical protein
MGRDLLIGGGGALAGAGGLAAYQKVQKGVSRANWALGIGVVVVALEAFCSSDLNADVTAFQALQSRAYSLTFSATATGAEVAALRSVVADGFGQSARMAYDANLFSFQDQPTVGTCPVGITAQTAPTQSTSNNNSFLLAVLLAIGVVALILWN